EAGPAEEVEARLRTVQPLVELRVPFVLEREEIDAAARGAEDADWDPLIDAAERLARGEDTAVFHGYGAAGIHGLAADSEHAPVSLSSDYTEYPRAVTEAIEKLREAGVDGPYAIALGPRCDAGLRRTVDAGGYPVLRHVQRLLDGPDVWAPALDGAVVLSMRGGDFRLVVGRDPRVGYLGHDEQRVRLYLEESFTFRLLGPEAAVPLVYR
ncbi:MAG: family 1 encapsulin nanocompartment shell protein, partial [Myxococcota bacterium]|nr:family 1 encapsulin nanocompartment shell protein [Myxococcota bacterium]